MFCFDCTISIVARSSNGRVDSTARVAAIPVIFFGFAQLFASYYFILFLLSL